MAPAELVDHLETTHHAYLHAELPRLTALADKVTGVHGARHPELADVAEAYARAAGRPGAPPAPRGAGPLPDDPRAGHGHGAAGVPLRDAGQPDLGDAGRARPGGRAARRRCAALTDGYQPPADGCASYRALYAGLAELEADTHLHVHKENNLLFPAVVALESAGPHRGRDHSGSPT